MKRAWLLILVLLAWPAPVVAQTVLDDRTEVISVTPPDGWVLSVWQGGTIELGEFTPPGQTGAAYVDLLGYSVLPRHEILPSSTPGLEAYEREAAGGCATSHFQPLGLIDGWFHLVRLCVGRPGAAPDVAELEYAATTVTDQGVYRVWRSHRAPASDFGLPVSPSQAQFDSLADSWASRMRPDLERREVCNLAAVDTCRAFRDPLAPELSPYLERLGPQLVVIGFSGHQTLTRQQFLSHFGVAEDDGSPNRVIAAILPQEYDWSNRDQITGLLTTLAYGQAADGALLAVSDEGSLSADQTALLRARIITQTRRLTPPGEPPGIVQVLVPR